MSPCPFGRGFFITPVRGDLYYGNLPVIQTVIAYTKEFSYSFCPSADLHNA